MSLTLIFVRTPGGNSISTWIEVYYKCPTNDHWACVYGAACLLVFPIQYLRSVLVTTCDVTYPSQLIIYDICSHVYVMTCTTHPEHSHVYVM